MTELGMVAKKSNFLTKKVAFGGKEMTLYSIDGVTWSTRADELEAIVNRHNVEQAAFTSDLKGEEREKVDKEKIKPKRKFTRVHNDDELDEVIEEDGVEAIDDDIPIDDVDAIDIDDEDIIPKLGKGIPSPMKGKAPKEAEKVSKMSAKPKGEVKSSKASKTVSKVPEKKKAASAPPAKGAKSKSVKPEAKPAKGKKTQTKAKKKAA